MMIFFSLSLSLWRSSSVRRLNSVRVRVSIKTIKSQSGQKKWWVSKQQKTNKKWMIKKGQTKAFFHSLCVHFFPSVVFTKNILLFASSSSSNDKHIVKKRERIGSNANTKYNVLVFVVFFSRVFLRQYAAENEVARLLLRFFVFFFFCAFEFVVFVGRRRKEEEKVCPPGGFEECRQKHEREDDDEAKKQRWL